jgi:hypothetical protein
MTYNGKAFIKPLPFALGGQDHFLRQGTSTVSLSVAQSIGMKWFRNDCPWNITQGGSTPIEGLPGVYSSTNIAAIASVAVSVKSYGMSPLFVVTVNQSPGICGTLSTALTNSNVYTSITITAQPFAISIGDTITLTNTTQAHTQNIVSQSNLAANTAGTINVTSFTANYSYGIGTWIYDTVWVACTPQHFATMMAYLVAQSGLQGLDWELFNEPDGGNWSISATMLYQCYALAYPAMKTADPTCTIHALQLSSNGGGGVTYYNSFVALGGLNYCDVIDIHQYWINYSGPQAPAQTYAFTNPANLNYFQQMGEFQAARIVAGDNKPLWLTEWGYPCVGNGIMTNQLQAQWIQDTMAGFLGMDTINNVPYSSYLKVAIIYTMLQDSDYPIIQTPSTPYKAVACLTELVAGN